MKDLFFCPDQWRFEPEVDSCIGMRKEIRGFDGKETEAWQIGDWYYNWTTIRTEIDLEPNTEYCFHFWLNGGENERYDEVCSLEVGIEKDGEPCQTFKLNRDLTRPVLHKKGWYLFAVPFTTTAGGVTVLRFHAQGAVATIAPVDDPAALAALTSDPINEEKVQRPNLVYPEGWPKSDEDPAFRTTIGDKEIVVTKQQAKKAAKIAGGVLVAGLILRHIRKRK